MLNRIFARGAPLPDCVQIEVTSHCNSRCIYCPRTVYQEQWVERHLPLDVYRKILSDLNGGQFIHLQGWGEPFLHPDFYTMIELAKKGGYRIGTTSNGTLLDENSIQRLIDSELDILALSLAGIDEGNDRIRKGTSVQRIFRAIDAINRRKNQTGSEWPRIHIAYLLFPHDIVRLNKIVMTFRRLGAQQLVLNSLSFAPAREFDSETRLVSDRKTCRALKKTLFYQMEISMVEGLEVCYNIASPAKSKKTCSENVQTTLFVGSNGDISPCVFTQLPLREEPEYYFHGQPVPFNRMLFGNVKREPLEQVWSDRGYRDFRTSFKKKRLSGNCRTCYKRYVESYSPMNML